jgi:hypothetical protein
MFDLEQSIKEWRQQMLTAGIKTPVPLDELENHLRDEIERQIQSGTSPQQAFENSVQQIGCADELKTEFNKTRDAKCVRRRKMLRMGVIGLSGTFVMNLFGMFVLGKSSCVFFSHQWWPDWFVCYFLWTTFTVIGLFGSADWKRLKPVKE